MNSSKVQCKLCKKLFASKYTLARHKDAVHDREETAEESNADASDEATLDSEMSEEEDGVKESLNTFQEHYAAWYYVLELVMKDLGLNNFDDIKAAGPAFIEKLFDTVSVTVGMGKLLTKDPLYSKLKKKQIELIERGWEDKTAAGRTMWKMNKSKLLDLVENALNYNDIDEEDDDDKDATK